MPKQSIRWWAVPMLDYKSILYYIEFTVLDIFTGHKLMQLGVNIWALNVQ